MKVCNLFFSSDQPLAVSWLQAFKAEEPTALLTLYHRNHSWAIWNKIWDVRDWSVKKTPSLLTTDTGPKMLRLEFRNPLKNIVDFEIAIRPLNYNGPLGGIEIIGESEDKRNHRFDDFSYYGSMPPEKWELALIIVSSMFGFLVIGTALYVLIMRLCKPRQDHFFQ